MRNHVGDDDDQLTEVVGVGCDARDDAPRRELVVERQVMLGGGAECARAQIEDDIAHRAHDQTPPQPVQSPQADSNPHQDPANRRDGWQRRLFAEQIHHAADHHRQRRANEREDDHNNRNEHKLFYLRSEKVSDPPRKVTVGILTVIFFVVKSSKEAHKFL